MAHNLRSRLKRIREHGVERGLPQKSDNSRKLSPDYVSPALHTGSGGLNSTWMEISPYVQKRTLRLLLNMETRRPIDSTLACLVPHAAPLFSSGTSIDTETFQFFDLETTGLSGGAGTIAFLAAVGRYFPVDNYVPEPEAIDPGLGKNKRGSLLQVSQYLLVDYPGEGDFLESFMQELDGRSVLVSYNGRAFDTQILRNRCLINGIQFPSMSHLDLLSTARALWRNALPSCRLSEIEASILGLNREGDLPGSEAPDAWFYFLKTGNRDRLDQIARHNALDLKGLATLFAYLVDVADSPLEYVRNRPDDLESLALRWHTLLKELKMNLPNGVDLTEPARQDSLLMEAAMAKGLPRVLFVRAKELCSEKKWEAALPLLETITGSKTRASPRMRALASRLIALDLEWRLKDFPASLEWVHFSLSQDNVTGVLRSDLLRRKARLELKIRGYLPVLSYPKLSGGRV